MGRMRRLTIHPALTCCAEKETDHFAFVGDCFLQQFAAPGDALVLRTGPGSRRT